MAPPLLTLQDIGLTLGARTLFDGAEMRIGQGDRICLVGRNGSGKSTLLRIAAGEQEADRGERFLQPGCRVAYLPQEPDLKVHATIADYVTGGLSEGHEHETHRVAAMLDALKIDGAAATDILSGGEARRAAIARALVSDPDILLLDEPTNHLDLPAIEWLESELAGFRGGLVIISHDRAFLNRLTRITLWLDRGVVRRLDKGFAAFEAWSEDLLAREEDERRKLDKLIAQETVWSHQGITARRKRNQGRLRRLHDMRKDRARQIATVGQAKLAADSGSGSGRLVVEAEHISKHFGERVIVGDFSTRILRGDRVGIIGPNGAGKTTLLRMLTGDLEPDGGNVRMGTNLTSAYLDQQRAQLDAQATVWDTLCDAGGDQVMVGDRPRHVVGYLKDFLFEEAQARSPVGSLSGGERNRLLLAKVLAKPSNFLVLDEPTNDLDMDTLDLLQEMLADYGGTVLLVSHDRDFLDRVVTSTIALDGDGEAREFVGGFSDYVRQRGEAASAAEPPRDKPKAPAASSKGGARTRLSYKQQRALDSLPGRMEALQSEIAGLHERMADPGFFQKDPDGFAKATARLEAAESELAASEEQWLELEMLREELAAGKQA